MKEGVYNRIKTTGHASPCTVEIGKHRVVTAAETEQAAFVVDGFPHLLHVRGENWSLLR